MVKLDGLKAARPGQARGSCSPPVPQNSSVSTGEGGVAKGAPPPTRALLWGHEEEAHLVRRRVK